MSKTATGRPRKSLSLVLLSIIAAGCGATGTPTSSPGRSESSTTASIGSTATPIPNSMSNPSIEGRFVVADDGRELALKCWGDGSPTLILEHIEILENIESSEPQVGHLAERYRVCAYDRAGTGASDPAPNEKRDADDVVGDLSALLDAASVGGPYLLLGRSFGGMIVTYYAQEMPEDVLGVVVFDTPAPSAEFTEESEPELVWDYPGNTEHLDVVGGFENRFAKEPPHIDAPLLIITPAGGESSAEDQRFWLQVSDDSEQVTPPCECFAEEVIEFIAGLQRGGRASG